MSELFNFFEYILNPELIFINFKSLSLFIILAIVFAETGLFIGFFLPGDSLLLTAGIFSKKLTSNLNDVPFVIIILMVALSAILGNIVGYWFGYKTGNIIFQKKESFFFKKKNLLLAENFFNKYKLFSLLISRFLPIFRTFSPIIAGVFKVKFKIFMIYNVLGALIWTFSIMMIGRFLEKTFPYIKNNLEFIILSITIVTTMPIILKFFNIKNKSFL